MALRAGLAALALCALVAPVAAADDEPSHSASVLDRPHTEAIVEAGIIALPTAPISQAFQGGQTFIGPVGKGDATLLTGLHLLYRASREWAVGATGMFAPKPTSDPDYPVPGVAGLTRTHSRSYLFLGGEARYSPLHWHGFSGWAGLTAGGIVIADRFTTNAPAVAAFFGTSSETVSTEGFALGVQIGVDYLITDQWVVGLALRGDQWILPTNNLKPFSQTSSCDALGDCPTLAGGVEAFEFGISLGYQLSL